MLPSSPDPLVASIWTCKTSKMVVLLWHLHSNRLYMLIKLREWRIICSDLCILCNKVHETLPRLFINCEFTFGLWLHFTRLTDEVVWKVRRSPHVFWIGDIIEGAESKHNSPCWGLHWIALATFTFMAWSDRNQCFMEGEAKHLSVLKIELINNIDILFSSTTFKAAHRNLL